MADAILSLLMLIGYDYEKDDGKVILALIEKVKYDIMGFCNIFEIPDELSQVVLYRVLGEFITVKKNCGQTKGFKALNFEPILSQISEGDTSVSYYVKGAYSAERRISLLATALSTYGKDKVIKFRRFIW
ncbi:MAG: hypothetical protein LBR74_04325 [Eubacterium sp.]|jgi:hypothetical protein|nr:hypothetical protein [Eubacterium sp.]